MITNQTAVTSIQRFPDWISWELYKTNGKKLNEWFCKDNVVFRSFYLKKGSVVRLYTLKAISSIQRKPNMSSLNSTKWPRVH